MNQDLSIVTLVLHASFVVQLVIAGADAGVAGELDGDLPQGLRAEAGARPNDDFEREFWSGKSLNDLYTAAGQNADSAPMERIFASRHARIS